MKSKIFVYYKPCKRPLATCHAELLHPSWAFFKMLSLQTNNSTVTTLLQLLFINSSANLISSVISAQDHSLSCCRILIEMVTYLLFRICFSEKTDWNWLESPQVIHSTLFVGKNKTKQAIQPQQQIHLNKSWQVQVHPQVRLYPQVD